MTIRTVKRGLVLIFSCSIVSEQLWRFNGQVEDSSDGNFFHPINGTEQGSLQPLAIRDKQKIDDMRKQKRSNLQINLTTYIQ